MLSFRKLICANLYRLTSHLIINRRYLSFRAHHYYQLYTYMGTISYSLVKVLLLWLTWASWTVLFIRCRIMSVFSSFFDLFGNNFLESWNITVSHVTHLFAVFRIHDILVWIRIRIRGSMPLTNGSGSCYFRHWPSRCQQKTNFFTQFFLLVTFWRYIYIIFPR